MSAAALYGAIAAILLLVERKGVAAICRFFKRHWL